jgi:hypothetical protein
MKLMAIFYILAVLAFSFDVLAAGDSTRTQPNGYALTDKNNNGITDAFEQAPQGPDSLLQAQPADAGADARKREGHKNYHGQHGKELDRGTSPHSH